MQSEFKSWNGRQAEMENIRTEADEDFFEFEGCSEMAKTIGADIRQLDSAIASIPQAEQMLDSIVQQASAERFISTYNQFKPEFELIRKYSDRIPMGKKSLGRRIKAVKALEDTINCAAQTISDKFYDNFTVKKGGLDITGEIDRLDNIRQEMDSAAKAYCAVKNIFPTIAHRADVEKYLKKIPRMETVRRELQEIEALLATDQSKDNFTEIKHKRKLVRFGFFNGRFVVNYGFLAGRLMKEANRLDFKEGRMRCESIYREIRNYVDNFDQLKKARAFIEDDTMKLAQKHSALQEYSNIAAADCNVLDAVISARRDLLVRPKSDFFEYTYLKRAKQENDESRARLDRLSSVVLEKVYSLAVQELRSTAVPKQPENLDELKLSAAASESSIKRMNELSDIFSKMGKNSEANMCGEKSGELNKFYSECLTQKESATALEQQMSDLKLQYRDAQGLFTDQRLIDRDFTKALAMMDAKTPLIQDYTPLRKTKEEYSALAAQVRKTVHEKILHGLDQVVELYEGQIQQTEDPDVDMAVVKKRLSQIKSKVMPLFSRDFTDKIPFAVDTYSERLQKAVHCFNSQLRSIEDACRERDDLKRKVDLLQKAMSTNDEDKILAYARWPSETDINPYTMELAKKYCSTVAHIKKIAPEITEKMQKKAAGNGSGSLYYHKSLDNGKNNKHANFYSHILEMGQPNDDLLKELRCGVLQGDTSQRLSVIDEKLDAAAKTRFSKNDAAWLLEFKARLSKEMRSGCFANPEYVKDVPADTLQRIRSYLTVA